jgi:tetratricopeptide (TPR) repeat protein
MKNTFLSRFTPSLMTAETLEAIFVQRHELVADLIEAIRESALTKNKHFRLLIGGRGMGKTHTISLIYHRLSKMDDLKDKLSIAWMREEEWGISSFLDLLMRIFRALEQEYPEEYKAKLESKIEMLYQMSADEAGDKAAQLLREFVGKRTLLLLMENLDDIFSGLGDIGQKQFRAYIQNYSFITILATTQRLFNGIKQKNAAFYGWFYPENLEQLELEGVVDLLERITKVQGNQELESFIQSPTGRDRISAIHHLAGGNYRVYIIFAEFLTRLSLDELIEPFMQTLDELTPYYQARMQWLSPQQRKIVDFLGDRRHAVTVKEIASYCFITHQTASSQLKDLRNKGYVKVEAIGRESFYELQEVLMRYCLDVKKQRGKPISLFVDFLRCWYTKDELHEKLNKLNLIAHGVKSDLDFTSKENCSYVLEREYIKLALHEKEKEKQDPRIVAFLQKGFTLSKLGKYDEAIISYDHALKINSSQDLAWFNRGNNLALLGKYEQAVASYNRVLEINPNDYIAWLRRGNVLHKLEKYEEAIFGYDLAIEINPDDDSIWFWRGYALSKLERYEEAIFCYKHALEINPNDCVVWVFCGNTLFMVQRYEEAVTCYDRALQTNFEDYSIWLFYSWALIRLKRYSEALESCNRSIQLNPNNPSSLFNRSIALLALNRWDESINSLKDALNFLADGETPLSEYIEFIIFILFDQTQDRDLWTSRIKTILEIFDNYKFASGLGQAIVKTIPTLMPEMISDKAAQTWLETWQELTGDRPEFQIPLRLLSTAVRYKISQGDRRVLLELAIEERSLLEPLVRLSTIPAPSAKLREDIKSSSV